MVQNKENENFEFDETHKTFWEQPDKHALVKEHHQGIEFFSVLTLRPVLSMLMIDDLFYAQKLTEKMIKNGVKVFDTMKEFYEFYHKLDNNK